jgi:hypothetical protein
MSEIVAGKFLAKCTGEKDVQFGYTKNNHEQIALEFELLNEGYEGQRVQWFGTFANEKSIEIAVKALRACGWQGDNLTDLSGIDQNEVELDIGYEEYLGKRHLRVRWVNRPGSGRVVLKEVMGEHEKKAMAQRLRGAIMALREPGSAAQRPAQSRGAPAGKPQRQPGEDEIPF